MYVLPLRRMPTSVVILVVFSGSSSVRGTVAGNFRAVFSVSTYLRASFRIGKGYARCFPLDKERFTTRAAPGRMAQKCVHEFRVSSRCFLVPNCAATPSRAQI